jgi:AdoMet-dependent rRNA methyltransferase SPB1
VLTAGRSQDYNALLYAFNQLFDRVDATKPVASRNTSAEIFVTCKGYKAPARIDPRLLDAKHLFKVASIPAAGSTTKICNSHTLGLGCG